MSIVTTASKLTRCDSQYISDRCWYPGATRTSRTSRCRIPNPVCCTVRRDKTNVLRETLKHVVATNRAHKSRLRNICVQVEVVPHARDVMDIRRRCVIWWLPVDQESVPVRRYGERRQRHV